MNKIFHLAMISCMILIISCSDQSGKNQKKNDNQKNIQITDTLIHAYTFGMSKEKFFELSWKYNSDGILINGSGAEIVENVDWLKAPAKRSFYPNFVDNKIVQFPIIYSYKGWAPWNTHLSADSLLQHLIPILSEEYDVVFEPLSKEIDNKIYVGRINNSEIELTVKSNFEVVVTFTDVTNFY